MLLALHAVDHPVRTGIHLTQTKTSDTTSTTNSTTAKGSQGKAG
ncbi:hypothetical protein [Streptomyces sp. HUAS TT7]